MGQIQGYLSRHIATCEKILYNWALFLVYLFIFLKINIILQLGSVPLNTPLEMPRFCRIRSIETGLRLKAGLNFETSLYPMVHE